ncbi:hypothetical protein KR222_000714 [Zaprionus bogoriensis]|nr:hypothetical protein KR222_000714 [Zaprionus bogoriensis]
MPASFHIVVKVLMLRLLLANLAGLAAGYDFGYHPSAEEFDSLLRDTRGWTRDLLANEHRRSDGYVPRYRYEQEAPVPQSELDFQLFSDDQQQLEQQPFVYESVGPALQPEQQQQLADQPALHVQSQLLEISEHLPPPAAAIGNSSSTSSAGSFPIFFTNPATGIVYAISEVGRNTQSQPWPAAGKGNASDAIAIYVTKQQYDADLQALRQRYEQQCPLLSAGYESSPAARPSQSQSPSAVSVLSTPNLRPALQTSTARPQIIRLQKPKKTASPSKLPHRPPPVMVPSGAADLVSDQLLKLPSSSTTTTSTTTRPKRGPSRTPKPKRSKHKKTKKKKQTPKRRPGHKLTTSTASTVGPQIVLGRRTTTSRPPTSTHLATQLEKPHMPPQPTVFSEHPFAVSSGYIELPQPPAGNSFQPHHLARRSLDELKAGSAGARPVSSGRRQPSSSGRRRTTGSRTGGNGGAGGKIKGRTGEQALPTKAPGNLQQSETRVRTMPHAVFLLHGRHNRSSSEEREGERAGAWEQRRKRKQVKPQARRRSAEVDFDLFELMGGSDYEDSDDAYYDGEQQDDKPSDVQLKLGAQTPSSQENSSSAEEGADFGAMEEEPGSSASSSTTTAMSPAEASSEQAQPEDEHQASSSKQSASKKRIKRRPNGEKNNSDEYYDDDDEEDDDEDDKDSDSDSESDADSFAGIGSFFRMIFYPVQLAMTRIFDGFTGTSDEQSEVEATAKPKYPTYTLYHSAQSPNALADDVDEDDDGSSLGSWFSSWFGLRRRTKKIGSTTAMPQAPQPLPTPAPEQEEAELEPEPVGWLESWFGFGKTTTQASSEEDDYDKWFSGWFEGTPKPKARRRQASSTTSPTTTTTTAMTSTSTSTTLPQVPILTIVDPLRNPQNWIGILAHHIVNATANGAAAVAGATGISSNPLLQALVTRASSTTTSTTVQPEATPRRISYDKYQIWRLRPQDEAQVRALEQFKRGEDGNKLQWLKGPSLRGLTDVLVPPKMLVDFQGTLNFEGIAHEVLIFDVGKAIAYERNKEHYLYTTPTSAKRPTRQPAATPAMTWNKYYEHDEILRYLETMRMRHTQLVELIHIGRSYEGRPLIVVKIESKQTAAAATAAAAASHKRLKHKRRSGQANAVFIEAGAQGLAWIGPASATWMISELLRHMRTNKSDAEHEFIRNTTWYIMPVLNPDGYVYSHEYDRFWRKSRSQHVAKAPGGLLDSAMTWLQQKRGVDKICYGVDLDRNWLYHWGKRGSSKAPCNEFYAGPAPFSEPETKAVSDFLMDYRTQIKLYISLQAYGQVVSYPVKANSSFNTERMDDFLDVAMVGTDGLRKKGSKTRYKVDSANDLIEQRSGGCGLINGAVVGKLTKCLSRAGCADAFAAYEIGIPFSYTMQLADNGVHGYLLPSSAIESTARDAFEIISGMLDYI